MRNNAGNGLLVIIGFVLFATVIAGYVTNFISAWGIDTWATMTAEQGINFVGVFLPPMGVFIGIVSWF